MYNPLQAFMGGMAPQFLPGQKVERKPLRQPPTERQATLYVRNLNEKIKIVTLRQGLETIFASFGKIVDVKVKRNLKHRGQAFVSFENLETATEAMNKAQGFPLFDKPMDIQYALEPSFAVSLLDGKEQLENHQKKRKLALSERSSLSAQGGHAAKRQKQRAGNDELPPNSMLLVQNLPTGTVESTLSAMFSQFQGFKEVRLVPGKSDIAFIEYDTEIESSVAKQSLHGYRISNREMKRPISEASLDSLVDLKINSQGLAFGQSTFDVLPTHQSKTQKLKKSNNSSKNSLPESSLNANSSNVSLNDSALHSDLSFFDIKTLNSKLQDTLVNQCEFRKMTLAQYKTIAPLLAGSDLHLLSKTGSGKTAAFLVPSIQKIIERNSKDLQLLVITPTRELAFQIMQDAKNYLSQFHLIKVGVAIGGTNISSERNMLKSGVQILIATPGRLLDHLSEKKYLDRVETFVLDECDRLLDMGFLPDITKIISNLNSSKTQNILCSATDSKEVQTIIRKLLKPDYVAVSTIPPGESNIHEKVPQYLITADFNQQLATTLALLEREASPTFKVIVFLPTAKMCDYFYSIAKKSKKVSNIMVQHSRLSQPKRLQVTNKFRDATMAVLFATDVVARGMDFPFVSHVIQVGVADSPDSYIHRVGRTGRAGKDGKGFIILDHREKYLLPQLQKKKVLLQAVDISITPQVQEMCSLGTKEFLKENQDNGAKVYQAWLGFYKARTAFLRVSPEQLVELANSYAIHLFGYQPSLERKIVGKMGLKGVKGLLFTTTTQKSKGK